MAPNISSPARWTGQITRSARIREAYDEIERNFDEAEKLIPAEDLEAFRKARRDVRAATKVALAEQEQVEKRRGSIEGKDRKHVRPVAMFELGYFLVEQNPGGDSIRYRHRRPDGIAGEVAFVDHGPKVEVHNWTDREAVLAAMQLAADKWGSINVTGSSRYKDMVAGLAAEHGIAVANPELQKKIEAERERLIAEREKRPGFSEGARGEIRAGQEKSGRVEPQLEIPGEAKPAAGEAGKPAQQPAGKEVTAEATPPGEKIIIAKPYDRETVFRHLEEANRKYGALQLEGADERFLELAVRVAAQNNIPIKNPELQDRYKAELRRVEYDAWTTPGIVNPVAQADKGRDAWNQVLATALAWQAATDTDEKMALQKTFGQQLTRAATLGMRGNLFLRELSQTEPVLAKAIMIAEADEELRLEREKQEQATEQKDRTPEHKQGEGQGRQPETAGAGDKNASTGEAKGEAGNTLEADIEADGKGQSRGLRTTIGTLLQTGQALYRPDEKHSMTSYAELRTDSGRIERLWGVTMPKAIIDSGAKPGDRVAITLEGTELVTTPVEFTNQKTGMKVIENREVKRNVWSVEVLKEDKKQEQEVSGANLVVKILFLIPSQKY